jgi:hypothetical protein
VEHHAIRIIPFSFVLVYVVHDGYLRQDLTNKPASYKRIFVKNKESKGSKSNNFVLQYHLDDVSRSSQPVDFGSGDIA